MDEPRRAPWTDAASEAESPVARAVGALVDEAAEGTQASLETLLVRTLVGLGLVETAGVWSRDADDVAWSPVRSFGGPTPPPADGFTSPTAPDYELAHDRRVVTVRAAFDIDGAREQHDETVDALVALTATLAAAMGGGHGEAPSALPKAG